ncbi:MAG TPA: MmcQ/YjbR family DNA-binding protein [Terriglobales bacterium]|jgi:predicted DNA-binding protein (MmcQ/YjbR family)
MDIDSIREYCLSFPGATEQLQWGDSLLFKVRGKIFTTVNLEMAANRIALKCTPELFADLIEREGIAPSPYVGRYNWVALESLDTVVDHELRDLIRRSYELVEAKAPKLKGKAAKRKSARGKALRRKAIR